MATIDAYGGRFIGNDFVAPRVRPRPVQRAAVPQPRYTEQQYTQFTPQPAPAAPAEVYTPAPAADFGTQMEYEGYDEYDVERRHFQLPQLPQFSQLLTIRNGVIAGCAAVLVAGLVVAVPHRVGIEYRVNSVAHRIALGASVDMHHTKPHNFAMPQNSILVKNSELSTFVDAIESQTVTINVGNASVTPKPTDLQKWFMTTAGPSSNSTIIEANTANISAYLDQVAQKNDPSVSSAAVSSATSQIAHSLLKYNGTTVSLPDE